MKNTPKHTNRLIDETSPYLLQHAHNPVDWYPWGEEALNLAKELDKPILLSIGYSACHWCHVMERESFEDDDVADIGQRQRGAQSGDAAADDEKIAVHIHGCYPINR